VLAGIAALLGLGWYLTGGDFVGGLGARQSGEVVEDKAARAGNRPPAEIARAAINSVLPSVPCTWLDIGRVDEGAPMTIAMRGVAGNGDAAEREIGRALAAAGLAGARLDFGDVAPINAGGCAALDTFRQVRADAGSHIASERPRFAMTAQADGPYAGRAAANAVVDLNLDDPSLDFALLGIEPRGTITLLLGSRGAFQDALEQSEGGRPISDEGNGRYRLHIDLDHQGWSGLLLLTGRGPFAPAAVAPAIGARGPDWQQQFLGAAANLGWRAEMVWFESVRRGDAVPAVSGDK
jgi:eukaryotic-like serine/threonine-protein kinase